MVKPGGNKTPLKGGALFGIIIVDGGTKRKAIEAALAWTKHIHVSSSFSLVVCVCVCVCVVLVYNNWSMRI
jgi:hypothetical protein